MGELEDAYFPAAEDSSAPEVPAEDAEDWEAVADQFEQQWAEQEAGPEQLDPLSYPPLDRLALSPEGNAYADQIQLEAQQLANQSAYMEGLVARVEGIAGEYDISSPQTIQQAAAEVDQAMRELFNVWLGQGADPGQAAAALRDADIDGAIRQSLEQVRYHERTNRDPSLRAWRAGREQQALKDAAAGLPPRPDVFDSPSWQRSYRAAMAYAQREQERAEQQRRAVDRIVGKKWWA